MVNRVTNKIHAIILDKKDSPAKMKEKHRETELFEKMILSERELTSKTIEEKVSVTPENQSLTAKISYVFNKVIAQIINKFLPKNEIDPPLEPKMSAQEILGLLDVLKRSRFEDVELNKLINKYGNKILNPNFLIEQINTIEDRHLKKIALNKLVDFQVKILGHEFGLGGEIKIKNKYTNSFIKWIDRKIFGSDSRTVALEGYERIKSHAKIADSMENYSIDEVAIRESCQIDFEEVNKVMEALNKSAKYMDFKSVNSGLIDIVAQEILNDIKSGNSVTLPTGWVEHSVEVTIYKGLLSYSNRGQMSDNFEPGIHIYQIDPNKIDLNFIKKLITSDSSVLTKNEKIIKQDKKDRMEWFESKNGMIKDLGGKRIRYYAKPGQAVGNCSFAAAHCGAESLLLLIKLERYFRDEEKLQKDWQSMSEKPTPEQVEEFNKLVDEIDKSMDSIEVNVEKYMRNFQFYNRKQQFEFFMDMMQDFKKGDRRGKILSESTEFRIISEMCNKFYNVNYKNQIDQFDQKAMSNLDEILGATLKGMDYSIANCIADLSLKGKDASFSIENYLNQLMNLAPSGAFLIYKNDKNEVFIEIKNENNRISKRIEMNKEKYLIDGQEIDNLSNLMENQNLKYPIVNYAILKPRKHGEVIA